MLLTLTGTQSQDSNLHALGFARTDDGYYFATDMRSRWFAYESKQGLTLADGIAELRDAGARLARSGIASEFYAHHGFVAPPYTIYEGVLRLAPYVGFKVAADGHVQLSTCYPAPCEPTPIDLAAVLVGQLRKRFSASSGRVGVAFSGGVDSAILLGALVEAIGSARVVAITREMTGYAKEAQRASRMCQALGVQMHLIKGDLEPTQSIERFMALTLEPVYDEAVPVVAHMVEEAQRMYGPLEAIVDGQGADSLFMGLPHNKLLSLYQKTGVLRPLFCIIGRGRMERGSTRLQRLLYRAHKVASSLKHRDPVDVVLESLGSGGGFDRSNNIHRHVRKELEGAQAHFGSIQKAACYFFMFRILPAREMQKYVLPSEQARFVLPFLDNALIERVFSMHERGLMRGGIYKKPIYDCAARYFGDAFKNVTTAPFYVKYDIGGQGVPLHEHCIKRLGEINGH